MKVITSNDEIKDLHDLFNQMNDGRVFNQYYRQGVLDAIDFLIYEQSKLKRIKDLIRKANTRGHKK